MSLKEICLGLDETVLEFFSTLDKIYASQQELENTMKEGYLLMSTARKSMGFKAVSALQYDTDMEQALVHVDTEDDDDSTTFHMSSEETTIPETSPESSESSGLRQRSTVKQSPSDDFTDLSDAVEELKMTEMKTIKETKKKDPLKWFGILVPQTLRQSQARFKRAVELSVDIANLEAKYLKLKNRYKDLSEQKGKLLCDFSPNIEEYDFVDDRVKELKEEVKDEEKSDLKEEGEDKEKEGETE